MLLVLSHTPGALCSAQQCLIFIYWQGPGDLGLPLHTCLTHGRPKIHTYHVGSGSVFILAPHGECAQSPLFGTVTEGELSFLLLVCPQWAWKALSSPEGRVASQLLFWGRHWGLLAAAATPWLLQYCRLSTEVGLMLETA